MGKFWRFLLDFRFSASFAWAGLRPRITLNGRAPDTYRPEQLNRVISGAPADGQVVHPTVRESLLLVRPDAADQELRAAGETAGLDDLLDPAPANPVRRAVEAAPPAWRPHHVPQVTHSARS